MKAIEFRGKVKDHQIQIPDGLQSEIEAGSNNIRVIVLIEDNRSDEQDYQSIVQEQFLKGYDKSDAIYDSY